MKYERTTIPQKEIARQLEICHALSSPVRVTVSTGVRIEPNQLKRLMNRFRYDLEDEGVTFATIRRKDARMLAINYHAVNSKGETQESETENDAADGDLPFE